MNKQIWVAGGKEFTSKRAAYRYCRILNGNRSGGRRIHTVQRKFLDK